MNTPTDGFDFRGVHCYRSEDDPTTFFYVPGDPEPEAGPEGRPQVSLLASDKGAILQLGARWTVGEPLLAELGQHLAAAAGVSPDAVNLRPAPVSVEGVALTLADESGGHRELKTAEASGAPPFNVIFSVQLTAAQKERVISAFNGREGLLALRYRGSLSEPVVAEMVIEGDVREYLGRVGPDASDDELLGLVEEALAGGHLSLRQTGDVSPELAAKSLRLAKEEAAAMLRQMAAGAPRPVPEGGQYAQEESRVRARAALTEQRTRPLERTADVSRWFAPGEGARYVQFLAVSLPEPS